MLTHQPVMLQQCLTGLNIKPNGIYLDLTLGYAGHAQAILKRIPQGKLIAFERDLVASQTSQRILTKIAKNFLIIDTNHCYLESELFKLNIFTVDGILLDLGASSVQLKQISRGFSYSQNCQLDMRMDQRQPLTAKDILNNYSKQQLVKLLETNANVKFARRIVDEIIKQRPISTSFELAQIVKKVIPNKVIRSKNPLKNVFLALRIIVNDELNSLKFTLNQAINFLKVGASLLVITFHSVEDKIVKDFFVNLTKQTNVINKQYKFKTFKPLTKEIEINKSSTSGRLRILTREH